VGGFSKMEAAILEVPEVPKCLRGKKPERAITMLLHM
jgi:hypothetical protein